MKKLLVVLFLLITTPCWSARDFDGATDRIDYGNINSTSGQAQTFSVWMFPDDSVGSWIFATHIAGDTASEMLSQMNSSERFAIRFDYSTTNINSQTNISHLTTSAWQNVVYTWDGSQTATNLKIYIDGSEATYDTRIDGVGTQNDVSGSWSLGGAIFVDSVTFNGRMAFVGWWDRVLSADEIAMLSDGYAPECITRGLQFSPNLTRGQQDSVSGEGGVLDGTTVIENPKIFRCK